MGWSDLVGQRGVSALLLLVICVLFLCRELVLRRRMARDSLTGALTVDALHRRIQPSLQRGREQPGAMFLIQVVHHAELSAMLDIADNKALQAMVADRLRHVAPDCLVARYASYSFLVWASDTDRWAARELAPHIIEQLSWPYEMHGQPLLVEFRLAVALYPDHGSSIEELERSLLLAMLHVEEDSESAWTMFEPAMLERQRHFRGLEHDLRVALASSSMEQFEVFLQPLWDSPTATIKGCEALLRWRHPTQGEISPALVIELAERTGLIVPLGAWVLETACSHAADWPGSWQLHVNLSVRQMYSAALPVQVNHALAASRLPPNRLVLEITESLFISQYDRHVATMNSLRARGIGVALDDFGVGYSSLTHLRKLPLDWVKLDRGFIADIETDAVSRDVVLSVLVMCRALGLTVVAEGVETAGQRKILDALGCHLMQGFLLGRPSPAQDIRDLAASMS